MLADVVFCEPFGFEINTCAWLWCMLTYVRHMYVCLDVCVSEWF